VAAIEAGKTIALANKESLVCAADVILPLAARRGVELRPVDSEHSAIWQCLQTFRRDDLVGLTLTASGGPFRSWSAAEMTRITPADALAHPTWSMGGKITVDSATLVNKGLEVIEAHHLFAVPYDALEVVIHPESIVHSLVEFADGSQLAQLSHPDMRLPIQYALTWPEHAPLPARRLSLPELGRLTFEAPDHERFPALRLCVDAGRAGRSYPAALSAADEVAVEAFLAGHLPFTGIPAVLEAVLSRHDAAPFRSLEDVEAVDSWARGAAEAIIHRLRG
jgi:1-deoxy-D-xylulose-5-phosphate reductoisomerase